MSSCAAPIYLHSPSLETVSATAANSFPTADAALKPFDDQQAELDRFSGRENLSVARLWTAARDAQFAHLLGMAEADRDKTMEAAIARRLLNLGVVPNSTASPGSPSRLWVSRRDATAALAIDDQQSEQLRSALAAPGKQLDLSCETLTKPGAAILPDPLFPALLALCQDSAKQKAIISTTDPAFATISGEIANERAAVAAAQAVKAPQPSTVVASLQQQIDAAVADAKAGKSVSVRLEAFRENIDSLLGKASATTKFAALDNISSAIDKIILGESCAVESDADKAKPDSKCKPVTAPSTAGRIEASWAVARALAQLADANARTRVAAQWLIAAKAIVAAEKQDAKLEVQRAQEEAEAHAQRLIALEQEASYLTLAYRSLHGPRGDCHGAQPGGDRGPNRHCAFASYVDAWNAGRIPSEILVYRPVQIMRSYAVLRARVAAQKQHALAMAAAIELKGYGAGGIKAEAIGQALFDIALIGTTAGH